MAIIINYKNWRKVFVKILVLIAIFVVSVILPLILYQNALNLGESIDIDSYLSRLETSVICLVIIGILIVILKSVSYLLNPISVGKIMISILTGVLYVVYIIISANAEILEIGVAWFYLRIDYSVFSLFIIPVPILAIIRNLLIFVYEYKSNRCKLVILDTLAKNRAGSRNQISKIILKSKEISPNIKRHVLKNFKEILHELETHHPHPLVVRHNKYKVTTAGQNFLRRYGIENFEEEKPLNILEVWTEADLENLARKRTLKNK